MRIVQSIFWWALTLLTLFIVDDLLFGPGFWLLSLAGPMLSTVAAFVSSLLFQIWLVRVGTSPNPGSFGRMMLSRLMLGRKQQEVNRREMALQRKAVTAAGAIIVTPVIGGVIPALLLYQHGVADRQKLKVISFFLAALYAVEFAAIHGGYGFGGLMRGIL